MNIIAFQIHYVYLKNSNSFSSAYCDDKGCEQICVSLKDGAKCLCSDEYVLGSDGKSCKRK